MKGENYMNWYQTTIQKSRENSAKSSRRRPNLDEEQAKLALRRWVDQRRKKKGQAIATAGLMHKTPPSPQHPHGVWRIKAVYIDEEGEVYKITLVNRRGGWEIHDSGDSRKMIKGSGIGRFGNDQ